MSGVTFQDGILQAPRASYDVYAGTTSLSLLLPPGMGTPLVVLYEAPSFVPVPVTVSGHYVIISKETLIALNSGTGSIQGVIVDASSNGFALSSYRSESGCLHFMVY